MSAFKCDFPPANGTADIADITFGFDIHQTFTDNIAAQILQTLFIESEMGIAPDMDGPAVNDAAAVIDHIATGGNQCTVIVNHRTLWRQVELRHQYGFTSHFLFHHPDHVLGQGIDLIRAESYPNVQFQFFCGEQAVIEQGTILGVGIHILFIQQGASGQVHHLLTNQLLLVKPVAQQTHGAIRVPAQPVEQILGAQETIASGEERVGFNQVGVVRVGNGEQAAINVDNKVLHIATQGSISYGDQVLF